MADRVETDVDGDVVVYYLDPATHLPFRADVAVTVIGTPPPRVTPKDVINYTYEFAAYHAVAGVIVPASVTRDHERIRADIEINPDHDASIFVTPPSPAATIDSWRMR